MSATVAAAEFRRWSLVLIFLGAILLGLVALVDFFIYLAAMVVMWILIAVFCVFTVAIGWVVGDPYVGAKSKKVGHCLFWELLLFYFF